MARQIRHLRSSGPVVLNEGSVSGVEVLVREEPLAKLPVRVRLPGGKPAGGARIEVSNSTSDSPAVLEADAKGELVLRLSALESYAIHAAWNDPDGRR